jgi:hypothetical protein
MTLTRLMPSLRRTLPDPIIADRWPEHTVASTDDVTVAGVSLIRLVEVCDTPCVHVAAAVRPGTGGRPSPSEQASVVVARVVSVVPKDRGDLVVHLDAEVGHAHPIVSESRLIGRISIAPIAHITIEADDPGSPDDVLVAELPGDLRVGDLVAVPCSGAATLHDVRQSSSVGLTSDV